MILSLPPAATMATRPRPEVLKARRRTSLTFARLPVAVVVSSSSVPVVLGP